MKKIILALPLAFALGACSVTTQGVSTATDSTVTAFQNICLALPSAHADFLVLAKSFNVKQSILDGELKAYNQGVAFCASGVVSMTAAMVKTAAGYVQTIQTAQQQAAQ